MLHVERIGAGPPLVMLHGWAMHGGYFAPLLPALAARFRVYVVDLPGHGHSAAMAPQTLAAMTSAVSDALDDVKEPLTVLGWSLGGAVALDWAGRLPVRIARLVLVATTPRFIIGPDWPCAMPRATLAQFGDELRVAYRLTLQRFLSLQVQGSEDGRATLTRLRAMQDDRVPPTGAALDDSLAALIGIDLRYAIADIVAPALVVTGDRDALTPIAAGAWLAKHLANGRHVNIDGAAHAPFLSHRAAFETVLQTFFDDTG